MNQLRVLGVGAGYFSQFQYLGWRNIDAARCVAIVNRDVDKAQALAERFGVPKVYARLDEALSLAGGDALQLRDRSAQRAGAPVRRRSRHARAGY